MSRTVDEIACFFESGHQSAGRAYKQIAARLPELSASVTFGSKEQVRLLQAADLLAWQSTKYAKDRLSQSRDPRRDFLSLMEHPHSFAYISIKDGKKSMGVEVWPISKRSEVATGLTVDYSGPIVFLREDGDGVPIIPVSRTHGWRMGGGRIVHVALTDLRENKFYLGFDEPRLAEAIVYLMAATAEMSGGALTPGAPVSEISVVPSGEGVAFRITLATGTRMVLQASKEVFEKFRSAISSDV